MAEEEPDTLKATGTLTDWTQTPGADRPALFSNRFYIIANPFTTRITFSEGVGGQTLNTHTAIVMPTSDAADLGRVLLDTIARNQASSAAAAEPPERSETQNATETVSRDGK